MNWFDGYQNRCKLDICAAKFVCPLGFDSPFLIIRPRLLSASGIMRGSCSHCQVSSGKQGFCRRKVLQYERLSKEDELAFFYRDVSTQPISLSNLLYSGISMGAQVWMMLCGTISRLFRFVHKCDINIWLVMWCGKSCVRKNQSWSEGYYIAIGAIMRTGVKEKIALLHR